MEVIEEQFRIDFLLFNGFSMISFASAIEPLRIANKLLGRSYFVYRSVSLDGNQVLSSSGLAIQVDRTLTNSRDANLFVVCSSDGVENLRVDDQIGSCLRRLEQHGTRLGAICTGSFLLARYKLLRGRSCTIHWEYLDIAKETFPKVSFKSQVFLEDKNLITSSGGTSPLDMFISLISKTVSNKLAKDIADIAIHHEKRESDTPQRLDIQLRFDVHNSCLLRSIELMENNVEHPLDIKTLCLHAGLSTRQIQRLFRKYIGESPKAYYKNLRLSHAQDLVRHTAMGIAEISLASGFQNSTHFAKAYRSRYGKPPSKERMAGHNHA